MNRSNFTIKQQSNEVICSAFGLHSLESLPEWQDPTALLAQLEPDQICQPVQGFQGFEEEAEFLKSVVLQAREIQAELESLQRRGSLEFLAKKLNKSARQVREYCKSGWVPGACQTAGGHWRVNYGETTLMVLTSNLGENTRSRSFDWLAEVLKAESDQHPDRLTDEELPPRYELIKRLSQNKTQSLISCCVLEMQKKDKAITYSSVSNRTGLSRATIRKYLPHLKRGARRSAYGNSPLLDGLNDAISANYNRKTPVRGG